jgi:hypothetical protein
MGSKEAARLVLRCIGKAVDIMVTIAFGMGDAEKRCQGGILLH